MEEFEEHDKLIERYLEGKMSQGEEEIFMHELNTNEELRKQYEDELLVSALLSKDYEEENYTANLSAVDKEDFKAKEIKKSLPHISSPFSMLKYIVAAGLIIAISVSAVFILQKKNVQHTVVAESNNKKIIPGNTDSSFNKQPYYKNTDSLAANLFNQYYTAYTQQNDPVEISNYYNYYRNKEYDKVILAKKSDYEVMGIDDRNNLLGRYMLLYKGLAYMESNNIENAIKSFNAVLKISGKNENIFYDAEWYCALSYLKENNINKTDSVLNIIIQSTSRYKNKAKQITAQLK